MHAPAGTGDYRLGYAGATWLLGTTTSPVGVTVLQPTSADISLSSSTAAVDEVVQLSGTVSHPGTGGSVMIQEDEGWGWYAIGTVPYGPDGTFVYNLAAEWEGAYQYRVRVPQTTTTAAATSNTVSLTVACLDWEWC